MEYNEYKEWKYKGCEVEGLLDQPTHCYFCESKEFEGVLRKFIHTPAGEYTAIPVEPFVRYICDACWDFRRKTNRGLMYDYPNQCSYCDNDSLYYSRRTKAFRCEQH